MSFLGDSLKEIVEKVESKEKSGLFHEVKVNPNSKTILGANISICKDKFDIDFSNYREFFKYCPIGIPFNPAEDHAHLIVKFYNAFLFGYVQDESGIYVRKELADQENLKYGVNESIQYDDIFLTTLELHLEKRRRPPL